MTRRVGVIAGVLALIAGAAGFALARRDWSFGTTLLVGLGVIAVLTIAALAVESFFQSPGRRPPVATRRSP
jgi:uncharacterized membrane protein